MKIHLPLKAFISLLLTFTVSVSVITLWVFRNNTNGVTLEMASKITEISNLINKEYYFPLDSEALTDGMLSGYVDGLGDKYATYYNLDTSSQQTDAINGDTHGIGIMAVESYQRDIYVYKVYRDSPAYLAGIKAGDHITYVNGEKVTEIGFSKAINGIKGTKGKRIELVINREGKNSSISLKTDDTDIQSVYSYTVDNGTIGVVQIIDFNKKTYPQFKAEMDLLLKEKIKAIIFDLRHNTGGTVDTAAKILDHLLPECDTVNIKLKDGKVRVRNKSDKDSVELPFVILTDGQTASSSEIFVSAMRHQKRATIIGEKTYGKALIQRTYTLKDGSKVKFTIGEFVQGDGSSYNGIGILPDIEVDTGFRNSHEFYFINSDNDKVLNAAVDHINQLS